MFLNPTLTAIAIMPKNKSNFFIPLPHPLASVYSIVALEGNKRELSSCIRKRFYDHFLPIVKSTFLNLYRNTYLQIKKREVIISTTSLPLCLCSLFVIPDHFPLDLRNVQFMLASAEPIVPDKENFIFSQLECPKVHLENIFHPCRGAAW